MRYSGLFDKILVTKKSEDNPWVLYQIDIQRPHLLGVTDRLICASYGSDVHKIWRGAKKGTEITVRGYMSKIRFTDIDFTQKDTKVFVCVVEDMEETIYLPDDEVEAALTELLIDYYNKTE